MSAALLSVPFASCDYPSLATATLAAVLESHGHEVSVHHHELWLAKLVGLPAYRFLSRGAPSTEDLLGERLFAEHAIDGLPTFSEYWARIVAPRLRATGSTSAHVSEVREQVEAVRGVLDQFVSDCAESSLDGGASLFGFSSTYQQTMACAAIARRIKAASSSALTILGGANCEGPMGRGLRKTFDCFDLIVCGEGETILPTIVAHHTIAGRNSTIARFGRLVEAPGPVELDDIPTPRFGSFFRAASLHFPERSADSYDIPFEASRGCWWGERHHCTFCGLNGAQLSYRRSSPGRVASRLRDALGQHPVSRCIASDNILDFRAFDSLVPAIGSVLRQFNSTAFFEVKANLKEAQIAALADARILSVQAGIESLSDRVLSLMDKGTSALQNVQALKLFRHYGIACEWSMLVGFPGEEEADYRAVASLLPSLVHLQAPGGQGATRVRIDRFSPLYAMAVRAGRAKPAQAYRYVFGGSSCVDELAYFFESPFELEWMRGSVLRDLNLLITSWQSSFPRAALLIFRSSRDQDTVVDTRGASARAFTLSPLLTAILRAAWLRTSVSGIAGKVKPLRVRPADLEQGLERLGELQLCLRLGDRVLGLPVGGERYVPRHEEELRLLTEALASPGSEE